MKKRVCVLAEDPSSLLRFIRALPLFVIHRMDWSLLRPLVTFHHEAELEDLRSAGVYVAGFVDPKIRQREDLWDLLVDRASDVKSCHVLTVMSDKCHLNSFSFHLVLISNFSPEAIDSTGRSCRGGLCAEPLPL